ncbi:MAG TPA: flagellar biosynthesis protein FlhF [Kofleriaceae bacterium]|nr:flagellar biosynthesis protein FlhF [Kofleriaceae bacterium]
MRVRKFEGTTMRDAIAKVKAELGDQAVIISTRQVRRGLLGTAIEISAAIDTDDVAPAPPPTFDGPSGGGPAQMPQAQAAQTAQELEKQIGPLRSELRSLRALVRSTGDSRSSNELRAEVTALRKLVEDLHRSNTPMNAPAAEPARRRAITHYETAAPAPAAAAPAPAAPAPAPAPARTRAATHGHDGPLTASSTGHILMLVGPTGVGKTTTIAKLAARAALIDNRRVGVITLDNYRVGGIEQIRTFTDLIGVPLQVAENPAQLADLIDPSHELTLIDTAGKSPRDRAAIDELALHIDGLDIEVHLVIPAGATAAQIDELVQRYSALAPTRLLFTKIDEYEHVPELALAPARTRLPITWITTGQAVPEDIEQPTSARVLELASAGFGPNDTRNRSHRAA